MKLRIAAIIAVMVLVGAIAIYWMDLHDKPAGGSQPVRTSVPAQNSSKEASGIQSSEMPPTTAPKSTPVARPSSPPATGTPSAVASAARPSGNFPPPPTPRATNPPTSANPPSNIGDTTKPPVPVAPDVIEKAAIEVDKVGLMLRDYRTRMGENPVGTNAEIMKAVMGGNPKQARLGPPEGQQINGDGELLDQWGTPYFFHQMSKSDMEIRSAGPDRKMWTADDVVGR